MVRIDELIFGYRVLRVGEGNMARAINLVLKLGLCAEVVSSAELRMKYSDSGNFLSDGGRVLCAEVGEVRGLVGFIFRARRAWGAVAAVAVAFVLYFAFGELVWDVRVVGAENISEYEIESALREAGFGVGSLWRNIDKNKVETEVLSSSESVGWISINRRGTVAYVDVRVKDGQSTDKEGAVGYTNIVADRACVIESVTVTKGRAVVKAGDVVSAGDILISGIVESADGVELCHAEGEVIGVCRDSIVTVVGECEQISSASEPVLCDFSIKIFNLNINIFKNYRNYDESCAIINDVEDCVLFGSYRLPFGIERSYYVPRQVQSVTYTEEQMSAVAGARMERELHTLLDGADLLKLKSEGELTEGEYRLTTTVVYAVSVGADSPIYADE